jgi:hypothetical protein
MTQVQAEAKSNYFLDAIWPRIKWLVFLIVLFVAINPLVTMGEPWIYVHAAIVMIARRFWVGKLF